MSCATQDNHFGALQLHVKHEYSDSPPNTSTSSLLRDINHRTCALGMGGGCVCVASPLRGIVTPVAYYLQRGKGAQRSESVVSFQFPTPALPGEKLTEIQSIELEQYV